jgi:hypothetical protein
MTFPVAPVRASAAGFGQGARHYGLPVLAVGAAATALVVLAAWSDADMLDYGVGVVPAVVPGAAAIMSIAVAGIGLDEHRVTSVVTTVLMAALGLLTAWSVAMLPLDALRVVGLVPLPLSGLGLVARVLLLVSGAAATAPILRSRRRRQVRCASCGRVVPGRLDAIPRWPAIVALVFALPYPTLRIVWAFGGTFGTTGQPLDLEPAVEWGATAVGAALVAFTLVLLVGRGPTWARVLLGLGGLFLGVALAVIGALAATVALSVMVAEGPASSPGAGLAAWTFLIVYGSWFMAGLGVLAGSWRYWARRRDSCSTCRSLLAR